MINKRKPIFERLPIPEELRGSEPELKMWRAFLDQMLIDVFSPDEVEREPYVTSESYAWMYDRRGFFYPDFYKVCELACVQPEWVFYVIGKLEAGESPYGETEEDL